MKEEMKELQKIKGIGEVLSRRLVESSYDTIARLLVQKKRVRENSGMNHKRYGLS